VGGDELGDVEPLAYYWNQSKQKLYYQLWAVLDRWHVMEIKFITNYNILVVYYLNGHFETISNR
jgi:hypothetical protein